MSGGYLPDQEQFVCQIGDILAPTFVIPNQLQRDIRYTVRNRANQVNADEMLRSGRWVIVERGASK